MKNLACALWLALWFGFALATWSLGANGFEPVLSRSLASPNWNHTLGFDAFGRDVFLVTLHASLFSAVFCFLAVLITCAFSLVIATLIAVMPERFRFFSLRVLDTLLAFPSLLIALSWAAVRGPGWSTLTASLVIGALPSFTRLIYVRTRELMIEPYVTAAFSMGASPIRVIQRHLIPMLGSLIALKIPILFASALMGEATLSFLGVGAPIGHETWGSLLADGRDYLFEAPHIALGAGIPLILTVLAFQLLAADAVTEDRHWASPKEIK